MEMPQFVIYPNFIEMEKYIQFKEPGFQLQLHSNSYGTRIEVDKYDTDEAVIKVSEGYKALMTKYNIIEHSDNLMLISLLAAIEYDTHYQARMRENKYDLVGKDLAKALLASKLIKDGLSMEVSFKSKTKKYSIKSEAATMFIAGLIKSAVESGNVPINDFGEPIYLWTPRGEINWAEVNNVLDVPVKEPDSFKHHTIHRLNMNFLIAHLKYINEATTLRREEGSNFSDLQLSFFYDLLLVMGYIDERSFTPKYDYQAKDYMRGCLMAHAKKIKRQGNKQSNRHQSVSQL